MERERGEEGGVEEARHKDNTGTRTRIDRTGETEREREGRSQLAMPGVTHHRWLLQERGVGHCNFISERD